MHCRRLAALAAVLLAACEEPAPPPPPATSASAPTAPLEQADAATLPEVAPPPDAASPDAAPLGPSGAKDAGPAPPASAIAPAAPAAPTGATAATGFGAQGAVRRPGAPSSNDAGPAATAPPAPPAPPAPSVPPAEAGSADAVAGEVDSIYVGMKAYSAKFKQTHTQKVAGVVRKQSGKLIVQKPNKISFRYDPPTKNRIVADGLTLKVYIAEDAQMFVSPVEQSEYPGALSFIMGRGLRPSFTFTFNKRTKFKQGPVLVGKPRSPTPHYETVLFYIDKALLAKKDPGTIRGVLILDAQGNRNKFEFDGVAEPKSISPGEFQFTPPPGTDIKRN